MSQISASSESRFWIFCFPVVWGLSGLLLMGLSKPVHVLQRGAEGNDIREYGSDCGRGRPRDSGISNPVTLHRRGTGVFPAPASLD